MENVIISVLNHRIIDCRAKIRLLLVNIAIQCECERIFFNFQNYDIVRPVTFTWNQKIPQN